MQHPGAFIAAQFFSQDCDRIVVRLARMNYHRQVLCTRETQLTLENFALSLAWRMVVMIIKPNLAPGNHAGTLFRKVHQALRCRIIEQLRIMWMDTDGGINLWILFGQLNRPFEHTAVRIAGPDVEHGSDPGISCVRYYFFAVGIVLSSVDVAMGIDEGHFVTCTVPARRGAAPENVWVENPMARPTA